MCPMRTVVDKSVATRMIMAGTGTRPREKGRHPMRHEYRHVGGTLLGQFLFSSLAQADVFNAIGNGSVALQWSCNVCIRRTKWAMITPSMVMNLPSEDLNRQRRSGKKLQAALLATTHFRLSQYPQASLRGSSVTERHGQNILFLALHKRSPRASLTPSSTEAA